MSTGTASLVGSYVENALLGPAAAGAGVEATVDPPPGATLAAGATLVGGATATELGPGGAGGFAAAAALGF